LSETHHGLVLECAMPQGLTRSGSVKVAIPDEEGREVVVAVERDGDSASRSIGSSSPSQRASSRDSGPKIQEREAQLSRIGGATPRAAARAARR